MLFRSGTTTSPTQPTDNVTTFTSNVPGDNVVVVVKDWDDARGGVISKPSDIKCGVITSRKGDYKCSANFQNGRKVVLRVKAADINSKIGSMSISYPDTDPLEPQAPLRCTRLDDNDMSCSIIASTDIATLTVNFVRKSAAKLVLLDAYLNQKSIPAGGAFPGITMTLKNKGTVNNVSGCFFNGSQNEGCSDYNVDLSLVFWKNGQKYSYSWVLSRPTPVVAPGQKSVINITDWAPVLSQPGSYTVKVYVQNENGEQTEQDLRFVVK